MYEPKHSSIKRDSRLDLLQLNAFNLAICSFLEFEFKEKKQKMYLMLNYLQKVSFT